MQNNNNETKLGCAWKRQTSKGEEFLSGILEIGGDKISFVGWLNRNPQNEKSPNFYLFESKPPTGKPAGAKKTFTKPATAKTAAPKLANPAPAVPDEEPPL